MPKGYGIYTISTIQQRQSQAINILVTPPSRDLYHWEN